MRASGNIWKKITGQIKMKIKTGNEVVFGIIGLPRMGTTLVNNVFNSYENCISISEPHWHNILRERGGNESNLSFHGIDLSNNNSVIPNLKDHLSEDPDIEMCGIKETYRSHQKASVDYLLNSEDVDFLVGVIRDPIETFDSWLRSEWGGMYNDVKYFTQTYKNFTEDLNKNEKTVHWVKYEDLCEGKSDHLNNLFDGELEFDDIEEIKKTGYRIGDMNANSGGEIFTNIKKSLRVTEGQSRVIQEDLNAVMSEFGYL